TRHQPRDAPWRRWRGRNWNWLLGCRGGSMDLRVQATPQGYRVLGAGEDPDQVNAFLDHLAVRNFAVATRRAYAYDLLSFLRFCGDVGLDLSVVRATDVFDYLGWRPRGDTSQVVVRLPQR